MPLIFHSLSPSPRFSQSPLVARLGLAANGLQPAPHETPRVGKKSQLLGDLAMLLATARDSLSSYISS